MRLTSEQIKNLSTDRLLNIYRNERFIYWFYNPYDDIDDWEEEYEKHLKYVNELKAELDTREHVPRKGGAKTKRQLLAKKYKGGRRSHKKKTK